VQLVLWAVVTSHGGRVPSLNRTPHPPKPPTPVALAEAVELKWTRHCAAPLRFVLTDAPTGAALAVNFGGHPRVVDVMRPEQGKFFTAEQRATDGAVVVVRIAQPEGLAAVPAGALGALIASADWVSVVEIPGRNGVAHLFALGLVAPSSGAGCEFAMQATR
jgi:hypothetical protein